MSKYVLFKELGEMLDAGKTLYIDENGRSPYQLSIGREKDTNNSFMYRDPDLYGQCYVLANNLGYAIAEGQMIYVVETRGNPEQSIAQKLATITAGAKVSTAPKKDAETERLIKEFHERFENELLQEFTDIAGTGKNTATIVFKTGPETRVGRDELIKMGFAAKSDICYSECKNSHYSATWGCYTVNVNWPADTFFDDDNNS